MAWEMERILRISVRKLMDTCLVPSLRRKLLISNVLESVLCSVDSSYYVGKPENETDVEMDEGENQLKKKTHQTKIKMKGQRQRRKLERIRNI